MATPTEKIYTVQAGEKTVRFYITVYFSEGIALTTFMPEGWTPAASSLPTSLDFAREVAQRYGLNEALVHDALIEVLQADEDTSPADSLSNWNTARVRSVEELAPRIHDDISSDSPELETKAELLAGFAESWKQAMSGNTRPIADLWDEINEDE